MQSNISLSKERHSSRVKILNEDITDGIVYPGAEFRIFKSFRNFKALAKGRNLLSSRCLESTEFLWSFLEN